MGLDSKGPIMGIGSLQSIAGYCKTKMFRCVCNHKSIYQGEFMSERPVFHPVSQLLGSLQFINN